MGSVGGDYTAVHTTIQGGQENEAMGTRDTGRGTRGNPGGVVALLDKRDADFGAQWMEALVGIWNAGL